MLKDLILKNRSYRRFFQEYKIEEETLKKLIDLARLSGSAANLQPLKYIISNTPTKNAKIFNHLAWAGYLKEWSGPIEGERPSAYLILLSDTNISKKIDCDHGIASQSILLGATEIGLGGCMIGAIKRKKLSEDLCIASQYEILLVLALGKPREEIIIEEVNSDESIKYWRDDESTHHVPKRKLNNIILT